jgi:hypothetical protein
VEKISLSKSSFSELHEIAELQPRPQSCHEDNESSIEHCDIFIDRCQSIANDSSFKPRDNADITDESLNEMCEMELVGTKEIGTGEQFSNNQEVTRSIPAGLSPVEAVNDSIKPIISQAVFLAKTVHTNSVCSPIRRSTRRLFLFECIQCAVSNKDQDISRKLENPSQKPRMARCRLSY